MTNHIQVEEQYVLIIIESLRANDKKTGTLLNSELLKLKKFQESSLKTILVTINSKEELTSLLESIIAIQKNKGMLPHLHFEVHGYENGLELNNGDRIGWSELMEYFVRINSLTKNYLVIYLSVCFGLSILKAINPLGRAPFAAVIAPAKEITVGQILSGVITYYDNYFFSIDFKESERKMNEALGEVTWRLVTINECFEKITRFEPDSDFGKEMIGICKNKIIKQNPKLLNKSERERDNEAKKVYKNYCNNLKSKRDYFLMNDLKK